MVGSKAVNIEKPPMLECDKSNTEKNQVEEQHLISQKERRRSEWLKGVIHLTTSQRHEVMAKKRNLEGNTKKNLRF